jgi:hypothetical protein
MSWITQEMISQIDGKGSRRVSKGRKSYRRLRNELKRATDKQRKNIWRAYNTILWNFKEQNIII